MTWTPEDEERLVEMLVRGTPVEAIKERFGVTDLAVIGKTLRLYNKGLIKVVRNAGYMGEGAEGRPPEGAAPERR